MWSVDVQAAIETRALEHRYGSRAVVNGLSLVVPEGSIFGFLGPNGAGKTTTIRLLLGLIAPHAGTIRVLGKPMPSARAEILSQVGAIVETPTHYDHLTGRENLSITCRLLGLGRGEIDRTLEIVGLLRAAGDQAGRYSLGMRQRLGIARALLGRPKLLILDEPTNGLDPDGIRDMRALIRDLPSRHGCTVLLCSHMLSEVEQVASHVGLMWGGRLLAQGSLADVLGRREPAIELGTDRLAEATDLLTASGLAVVEAGSGRLAVRGHAEPADLNFLLTASGIAVSHLARREQSLEDLYLDLSREERLLESCR
jgi:lantibiotic transport system ATP-binding protein